MSELRLYFVIYSSVPTKVLSQKEIDELVSSSRKANSTNEITGVLLCLPGMYLQLIEGTKHSVDHLYKKIQKDKRHIKIETLQEGPIHHRFFPEWSMAYECDENALRAEGVVDLASPISLKLLEILQS